ncbi:MAG: hypothetical protein ABIH34_00805 [Nanoarchaeota archaeon]
MDDPTNTILKSGLTDFVRRAWKSRQKESPFPPTVSDEQTTRNGRELGKGEIIALNALAALILATELYIAFGPPSQEQAKYGGVAGFSVNPSAIVQPMKEQGNTFYSDEQNEYFLPE